MEKANVKLLTEDGRRIDGRGLNELRKFRVEAGVLKNADGSAYIELGRNKIMVAVYGPKEVHPRHEALPDRMLLRCRYSMLPFSVADERKSPSPTRREVEISKVIREALEPAIFLEEYPRTSTDVFIEVIEADGSTRVASITAAAVALADAGIPMKDLVVGVSIGKIEGRLAIDLSGIEDQRGEGDMPIALMPRLNEITLLQADGSFSRDEIAQALQMVREAAIKLYEEQRRALKDRYSKLPVEVEIT
ncbi:MAG: exosome complex exonuclease Rrp41 [Thermofilaceae archaeon]|nr:exosome complex exonuclease Rrp41 [Thermofilaceae archaeon]MDW8004514.1 exosome complex exonuclease Rrp41 [Thermofilaceae archaeon]